MASPKKSRGTWIHRAAIRLFTLVLAVLVFWLLGFLLNDIRSLPGPDYSMIEAKHVDQELVKQGIGLDEQIAELTRQAANQAEQQRVVGDSSNNLQQTINQLLELQRIGLQKNVAFSDTEQSNFTNSLNLFLENQRRYQGLSQTMAEMLEQKQNLIREKQLVELKVEKQRAPARREFNELSEKLRLTLAFYQLLILLAILGIAAIVLLKNRTSIYFPLYLAFGGATLLRVTLVIHEYFPTRYVKYILIGGLMLVVARLLIHFIRVIAYPKPQWLINQYREAYERFLCPVCDYPIRMGPRRFMFWTRRTVNKVLVSSEGGGQEETYTCPACGTALFEPCLACDKVRHALLPSCSHCGVEKGENSDPSV